MKMKPVFSDKERDTERDLDITTVSKVVETKETKETPISNVVNMVTKEEAENIARQYADRASEQAVNVALEKYDSRRREDEERRKKEVEIERDSERDSDRKRRRRDEEDDGPIISSKTLNDLKNIAGVFNALKEFSANPLQKAIEGKVGDVAAGVVERAFSPPSQHQEKDIIDRILNSNFASGLGAGLGQRGPELVDTFTRNFGKEKVDGWITGAVKGGGSGGGIGGLGGMPGMGSIGGQSKQQSEMEMVLSLDRNNAEHVAAYAHSQGDMTIETARKVLGIHQDDFIDQLKKKGVDTSPYETRRHQENNQSQNQEMSNQYQEIPNQNQYQEYRRPPPRVNEDLIVNTPATEDNRWREQQNAVNEQQSVVKDENEKADAYVNSIEKQDVDLHPHMERVEKVSLTNDNSEIMTYLKNMNEQLKLSNDSIIGLKDISEQLKLSVERQNNDMFNLQSELEVIKKDRQVNNNKEDNEYNQTTVRSMKTIKKGFSYVKTEE